MDADPVGELLKAMAGFGQVEGAKIQYEWRFADGDYARLPTLAKELAELSLDLIVAEGTPATLAARDAAPAISVVMTAVGDPVGTGLVKSLAQPGGNITGISQQGVDAQSKELDLLRSVKPNLSRVGYLSNPGSPASFTVLKSLETVAQKIGVRVFRADARSLPEIQTAFSEFSRIRPDAIIVGGDLAMLSHRKNIVSLAARNRIIAVYLYSEYVDAGGLMSYGPSLNEDYKRAATYVNKILNGAKPRDLPVEQPTTLGLVLNLKTAAALGVTFPRDLLVLADRVIE